MSDSQEPVLLELAPLPREKIGPFILLGLEKDATAEETEARLHAAGFRDVATWLEPWPVVPPEPRTFLRTVCLRTIPDAEREAMVEEVLAALGDPPTLDYVRLNISAVA